VPAPSFDSLYGILTCCCGRASDPLPGWTTGWTLPEGLLESFRCRKCHRTHDLFKGVGGMYLSGQFSISPGPGHVLCDGADQPR
jgi:hypothetical protein